MKTRFLSRFTPSLMSPEALEAIFVQRENLLKEVLERIRSAATARTTRHTLLIGPRGIGKTHFISMTYYRVRGMCDLEDALLVAWLREEEWGIASFRDLLLRVLRSLPGQVSDASALEKCIESLRTMGPAQAETAAAAKLKELAGSRTLLMLVENLGDLFQGLGTEGQRRFRSFLAENQFLMIVATSPACFADLLRNGAPFSGLFDIVELQELSFEDATQLVSRIALYEGNAALSSFINTARGRARMRALRYLAGGNHRAYVIFSQLLARESLEDLVEPLMRAVDDLTPYYHSRIAALSPDQRKIVEYVCEMRHPVRAVDVARDCFLMPSVAGAELEALTRIGHVHLLRIGRNEYFELREPLMRLSIEVKKHRGKPIRLLLDFLRLWYSPSELKQRLSVLPQDALLEREYAVPALQMVDEDWTDPRVPECCQAYNEAVRNQDYCRALLVAEELVAVRGKAEDMSAHASCLIRLRRYDDALSVYNRLVHDHLKDAATWKLRAWALLRAGHLQEALASCEKSIELDPDAGETWSYCGSILLGLGRFEECLSACDRAMQLKTAGLPVWTTRGNALAGLGRYAEASQAFSNVVKLDPESALAHFHLSAALVELKRYGDALAEAERAMKLDPKGPVPYVLRGYALSGLGRGAEALDSFDQAIGLGEQSSLVHFKRAQLMLAAGRWREGAALLDGALARFAHHGDHDAGNTPGFIRDLMPQADDPETLRLRIKVLALLYRKHNVLSPLGQGLVESISDLGSMRDDATARVWLDSWKQVAGGLPEFRLPLRLLESAVRYRETRDASILMELPQEERALLEPLVNTRSAAVRQ